MLIFWPARLGLGSRNQRDLTSFKDLAMTTPTELSKEAFLYLAQQAGLDVADRHMEELYLYVVNVLASIESLALIDVSGFEPEMAFSPPVAQTRNGAPGPVG